jgi:hypothetical protein
MTPPDTFHVDSVCKLGHGEETCRYLAMSANGWSCEKLGPMRAYLDNRVKNGSIRARGDNCEGRGRR